MKIVGLHKALERTNTHTLPKVINRGLCPWARHWTLSIFHWELLWSVVAPGWFSFSSKNKSGNTLTTHTHPGTCPRRESAQTGYNSAAEKLNERMNNSSGCEPVTSRTAVLCYGGNPTVCPLLHSEHIAVDVSSLLFLPCCFNPIWRDIFFYGLHIFYFLCSRPSSPYFPFLPLSSPLSLFTSLLHFHLAFLNTLAVAEWVLEAAVHEPVGDVRVGSHLNRRHEAATELLEYIDTHKSSCICPQFCTFLLRAVTFAGFSIQSLILCMRHREECVLMSPAATDICFGINRSGVVRLTWAVTVPMTVQGKEFQLVKRLISGNGSSNIFQLLHMLKMIDLIEETWLVKVLFFFNEVRVVVWFSTWNWDFLGGNW